MIIKEKTELRLHDLQDKAWKEQEENKHVSLHTKLELEYYMELLQELEILEIFKNKFCIKTQKALFNKRPMYIINIMGHDIFIPKVIYNKLKQWLEGED